MTSNEIRSSFLKYFAQNGHRVVGSSPLVPGDDPTLLFTNAGMNQFKDVFLGRDTRTYTRATSSQKCMRVSGKHNDLDNVGPSLRHHTFFEMLGNFSFGDYFKKDAIRFAWELLTDAWKMSPDRLLVSVFKGEDGIPRDVEAYDLWRQYVPADRILELGSDDNFWQMGDTGPCGRCSEIYYARGTGTEPDVEIWNNVFMEFERGRDGQLTPLPAPSIDTGMGLERITAILQDKQSNYDTDVFVPILKRIGELAAVAYGRDHATDIYMRVIADHIRATTFLIGDGVIPSNEWRGYVLRKIMRRAMRHGKHLGMTAPFLHKLVAVLDREMAEAYPELRINRHMIEKTILAEENRFEAVLTDGLPLLEAELTKVLATKGLVLSGEAAFKLYDTFGVPFDFIEDTAVTQGITVDREGFERAMDAQRVKGRAHTTFGGETSASGGLQWTLPATPADIAQQLHDAAPDHFVGYDNTRSVGPILMMWNAEGRPTDALTTGEIGYVALAKTPFYAEAGGQVDDRGELRSESTGAIAVVEAMVRRPSTMPRVHKVRVTAGRFSRREIVTADVAPESRDATRRNHTATHLLHAALRQVLGTHVKQAGSLVAPDRLRFDFVHFQPVTRDELDRIEQVVNDRIYLNAPVTTKESTPEEAIAAGAMALFGEKYGDRVRVVSVPGFSMELCGGIHVRATGDIGFFAIVDESGVAAGVRRIEAVTGADSVAWAQHQRAALESVLDVLGVSDAQAVDAIRRLQTEHKRFAREVSQLKAKLAMGGGASGETEDTIDIAGIALARRKVADLDKDALRRLADSLKARIKSGVVVIASANDGKVQIIVSVTSDLTARLKAGQIVKELAPIVGGGGGGRPDFAEAGGRDPGKIDEMLERSRAVIEQMLART